MSKLGLVLTGGGARSAYQIGALKAIYEIAEAENIKQPFDIITGNSAGSINATYMAAEIDNPKKMIKNLEELWSNVRSNDVFEVGYLSLLVKGMKILFELTTGNIFYKRKKERALLDTAPLRELIDKYLNFPKIQKNIDKKLIHGVAIKAINYSTGYSETIMQGSDELKTWKRHGRVSRKEIITREHIMGSTAIPILFPPVKINKYYYGDGSLRSYTPLSPAIKMGANKIIVIGVSQNFIDRYSRSKVARPSIGRILSLILNSVLLDAIDLDSERLNGINNTLRLIEEGADTHLKPVDLCVIRPSVDISRIAAEESDNLPRTIRHLLQGLGTRKESSGLTSYLLFEPSYTRRLIDIGYKDAYDQKDKIIEFIKNSES